MDLSSRMKTSLCAKCCKAESHREPSGDRTRLGSFSVCAHNDRVLSAAISARDFLSNTLGCHYAPHVVTFTVAVTATELNYCIRISNGIKCHFLS